MGLIWELLKALSNNNDKNEEVDHLDNWQKELIKKGNYDSSNFEEEDLEDDDYHNDDLD